MASTALEIRVDTSAVQAQLRELLLELEALDATEGLPEFAEDRVLRRLDALLADGSKCSLRPTPSTGDNVVGFELVCSGWKTELIAAARGAAQGDFVGHGGLHAK